MCECVCLGSGGESGGFVNWSRAVDGVVGVAVEDQSAWSLVMLCAQRYEKYATYSAL